MFPLPDLFLKATQPRLAKLVNHWLKSRKSMIWRTTRTKVLALPISNKIWNEIIYHGFAAGGPVPVSNNKKAFLEKWLLAFGFRIGPDGILQSRDGSSAVVQPPSYINVASEALWNGRVLKLSDGELPEGTVFTELIWELYELNFRYDLLALEKKYITSDDYRDKKERFELLCRCFHGGNGISFQLSNASIPKSNVGLQSDSIDHRHTYVCNLAKLMLRWQTPIPVVIPHLMNREHPSRADKESLEEAVANFYCQLYHGTFGHSPTVPRRMFPPMN